MSNRQLWIDKRGYPVITSTPNGERNATRWGWKKADAIPAGEYTAEIEAAEKRGAVKAFDEGYRHGWGDREYLAHLYNGSEILSVDEARVDNINPYAGDNS